MRKEDAGRLGGPLEPLFLAGSGDDALALAPADLRSDGSVLVPECVESGVEPLQLVSDNWVMRFRELVPQLDPALALAIDLGMNLLQRSLHVSENALPAAGIPYP